MSIWRDILILVARKFEAMISDVHTHLPAQVISYSGTTNLVSVQPCINRLRLQDGSMVATAQLPVLDDIPVKQFGSGKCILTIAPQVGSYGILHVSERELETWITEGGIVNPNSGRKFDISDCFFDPGVYPIVADGDNGLISPAINTDRIELRTRLGTTYVAVLDDGNIEIDTAIGAKVTINGNFTVDP